MKEVVLGYIKKKKLKSKEIEEALLRLPEHETGKINPTHYKSSRIKRGLLDLLKLISEAGHKDWVKENFPVKIRETYVFRGDKTVPEFSYEFEPQKLSLRYQLTSSVGDRKDTELWGVREHLMAVYKALNHEIDEQISEDVKNLMKQIQSMKSGENRLTAGFASYYMIDRVAEKESESEDKSNNQKRENYKLYAIRIHNYLTKELNKKELPNPKDNNETDNHISKITIVLLNNGKHLFAINNDYKNAKKITTDSDWWQILIKEIKERGLPSEKRMDLKPIPKEMVDYFNYNSKKCPIYFNGKYQLTNILIGKDVDVIINPDIKSEFISEKKYQKKKGNNLP